MSLLEKINLLNIGLASYNFKQNVASDIPSEALFIPPQNLASQKHLDNIANWTEMNKMELNVNKTKVMCFNFTNNFQFSTRLKMSDSTLEIIDQAKLLGVIITKDLSWDANTQSLVRRANARMRMLHKLLGYGVPVKDLLNIYVLYIRSVLEQSCTVWHSSLTSENSSDLERIQKNALKIILGENYLTYEQALASTGLESLHERRDSLCLRFARNCLKTSSVSDMFPPNVVSPSAMNTRGREHFQVTKAKTERLKKSAIPHMQRLLNENC